MMFFQNVQMALASIRASKLRAFLTMLGIIIGVSSVVTVIAAGAGVKRAVTDQVASFGTNLIQVNPGRAFNTDGEGGESFNFAATLGSSTLTEKDVSSIGQLNNVAAAAPAMLLSGVPKAQGKEAPSAFIMATTPKMLVILNRQLAKGQFLSEINVNKPVAVVGSGIVDKLFDGKDALNQQMQIRGTNFKIIGVMEKEKTGGLSLGPSFDDVIHIPFNIGKKLNGGTANIIEIDIKAANADVVEPLVKDIKARLKTNHGGEEDFTVLTAEEQLKIFDSILRIMTSFVAAIAGISLLVGGIGVMNIMFVSVTERTREIGIRKAIGANRRNILAQFLVEGVVISLIGGMLGVGLALLMGLGIKATADFAPVFSANAFVVAIIISTVVGVIFSTAPAIKAARKNPIEALRYE